MPRLRANMDLVEIEQVAVVGQGSSTLKLADDPQPRVEQVGSEPRNLYISESPVFSNSKPRLRSRGARMIPPPAQRQMSERTGSTVVEVEGSHAIYQSQPAAVAELIEEAAQAG